ncbi:MAG: hypothetical protein RR131_02450 [Anaerovorax sp.]
MKLHPFCKKAHASLCNLSLADQCLLVFMLILMFQSAHNLFFHELVSQKSTTLDIVIRTTAAAIFGYFISANFQNGSKPTGKNKSLSMDETAANVPSATHPFSQPHDQLQILVVAIIGIYALVLLIVAHNYFAINNTTATATISQLRDFVSGSVGFLMGHSTHEDKPT